MSYLRQGKGAENRRSVFYAGNNSTEEWELVDAPPKDFIEQKSQPDTLRRTSTSYFSFNTSGLILILCLHSPFASSSWSLFHNLHKTVFTGNK